MITVGALMFCLGCGSETDSADTDQSTSIEEGNRLMALCRGTEDVPTDDLEALVESTVTLGPALGPDEYTEELEATLLYEHFYCDCIVFGEESLAVDDREAYVSDPPASARRDCEDGARLDTEADPELGQFLPDDPFAYLESLLGSSPTGADGS